ncbi:MAG: sigma-70 family RNA polymerase sigma factor [Microthrixaceae bacterium]|nr:sigma-70 family RNA polymerase sigma factor [Acidimicrobiales bacterium]MCB1010602.1 sigma-70 family RNA polymerase sigma factor [Microthrixaceae bacterium]MCO5306058.1 sigma-70 family RNA polymerase sigma factor [Microthrixaceae bacterium]
MDDGHPMTAAGRYRLLGPDSVPADDEWIGRLRTPGPVRDQAVQHLHALMLRAARHRVSRMPDGAALGAVRRDEIAHAAADEATLSALGRLDSFEGRSRFTTWAYKFGILCAGVEMRRALWRDRDVRWHDVSEPLEPAATSPESFVEGRDLAAAVRDGLTQALTDHQRRVVVALLVDGVPIDVVADRLGSNRNAIYKTLHDARRRLRTHLEEQGFTREATTTEVTR